MTKYFKLDKDKREIVLDKTKHYNVNIDILDLIIDLKQELSMAKSALKDIKEILDDIDFGYHPIEEEYAYEVNKRIDKIFKELKNYGIHC